MSSRQDWMRRWSKMSPSLDSHQTWVSVSVSPGPTIPDCQTSRPTLMSCRVPMRSCASIWGPWGGSCFLPNPRPDVSLTSREIWGRPGRRLPFSNLNPMPVGTSIRWKIWGRLNFIPVLRRTGTGPLGYKVSWRRPELSGGRWRRNSTLPIATWGRPGPVPRCLRSAYIRVSRKKNLASLLRKTDSGRLLGRNNGVKPQPMTDSEIILRRSNRLILSFF